tara:strand:+ start:283 stop:1797 length:1515 start_codon:yes stop_codon:yes gene_type:complete
MTPEAAMNLAQKGDFLMSCQSRTGIYFDQEKAMELYEYCCDEMEAIKLDVEARLPLKARNKKELADVTPPKVQMKNSKQGLIPSANAHKWYDSIREEEKGIFIGTYEGNEFLLPYHKPVSSTIEMQLKHQLDIKNWLMKDKGWQPTMWNLKKDKNNKTLKVDGKVVKTTPKFHDQGTICPNLETLKDTDGLVKPIIRWLSLRNRRSVVYNPEKGTGWLSNPRLKIDGRLPAGALNITNTHRQKHKVVANIPRVSSYLGKEMRELFCAEEGKVLVGYDASSLEAFIKGHFCFPYEGGEEYFKKITHPDFDEHQATADAWGLANRQDAKAGNYGLQYNQGVMGLAETYKIPRSEAKFRYDAYWEINKPWKLCLNALEKHWEAIGKKGIKCGVTGHFLHSRSAHSLGSLIAQHTGAIAMDYSLCLMDRWLGGIKYDAKGLPVYIYKGREVRRVCYYHDEAIFETDSDIAQEILEMGIRSITKAGEGLKLNVPLSADGAIGHSWASIH